MMNIVQVNGAVPVKLDIRISLVMFCTDDRAIYSSCCWELS